MRSSERGASAVVTALAVLVLFGFAAVAIDATGIGFNDRRQSQSAADVGALAAVQFATPVDLGNAACSTYSGINLSRCNGAVEAMDVANATLDDVSLVDWSNGALCPAPPAGFTTSPITDCVAFTSNNQRAWVRIPEVQKPTTLARVIGINSITISADAIAGSSPLPAGSVLPFLLPGNAAGTNYNCLKTAGNPKFGACEDLPATGNFGSMDFFLYGDLDKGWTQKCTGDTNGRLTANIARGVDHPLGKHPTGSGAGIEEDAHCPDVGAEPDMANGQPGVGSGLEDGLLYGGSAYASSSYPGRIEDAGGFKVRNGGGSTPAAWVDDTPLWTYLSGAAALVGTPCDNTAVADPTAMIACIDWAKNDPSGPHVVFNDDLVDATRYGWTPGVWESDFLTPGSAYHIKDFQPVYIDTTMFACNANSCDIMYTPGVADSGSCPNNPSPATITCGTPGNKNKSLNAVTAYILSQSIVPDNAKTPSPGDDNQRTYNLTE